ncbi:hypothetical protein GCM10009595_09740 [Falsarthrobacter nasiphocae]
MLPESVAGKVEEIRWVGALGWRELAAGRIGIERELECMLSSPFVGAWALVRSETTRFT